MVIKHPHSGWLILAGIPDQDEHMENGTMIITMLKLYFLAAYCHRDVLGPNLKIIITLR